MIKFKKLKYKNFLSSGNKWIEVDFLNDKKKVFIGKNGTGKSTINCALSFALYNKSFRKSKKNQLINNINGKNLEVCLEFSIGNKEYKIERGVMPNFCRFYIDGTLKDMTASLVDYQSFIENTILRMSEKTFRQIVVLGSTDYVPFMKLQPYVKRSVVEDLLNISVFSNITDIIKIRATKAIKKVQQLNLDISVIENRITTNKNSISVINDNNNNSDIIYNTELDRLQNIYDKASKDLNKKILNLSNLKATVKKFNLEIENQKNNLDKVNDIKSKIENNLTRTEKESKFLLNNKNCHVCLQDIDEDFKHNIINKNKILIEKYNNGIDEVQAIINKDNSLIKKYNNLIKDLNEEIETIKDLVYDKNLAKTELNLYIKNKSNNNVDNLKIKETIEQKIYNDNIKLDLLKLEYSKMSNKGNILSYLAGILKDDGIKSKIIKTYLPIINKLMQKYLDLLNLNITFEFNEFFEETIIAQHSENFGYGNFSTGQQLRIDLAILFLWRDLAKLKNSTNCNLLILDEITSSSMDSEGVEAFNSIIDLQIDRNDTVIIITHNLEAISGREFIVHEHKLINNFTEVKIIN